LKLFRNKLLTKFKTGILLAMLCLCAVNIHADDGIGFQIDTTLTADNNELSGLFKVTLESQQPVYNAQFMLITEHGIYTIHNIEYWEPAKTKQFSFSVPNHHELAGRFHTVLHIAFMDRAGAPLVVNQAFSYRYGQNFIPSNSNPSLSIKNNKLEIINKPDNTKLTIGPDPLKNASEGLTHQRLERVGYYTQIAILSWQEHGYHQSKIQKWYLGTDKKIHLSRPVKTPELFAFDTKTFVSLSILMLALLVIRGGFRKQPPSENISTGWTIGILASCSAFILFSSQPASWLIDSWPSSGDMASQNLAGSILNNWLSNGKITGWTHSTFAGLPLFTFYFPLPFVFASLLSWPTTLAIGLKLAMILPSVLMPLAAWFFARSLSSNKIAALLFSIATTGFVLHEGNNIWGGNLMAQLAGEFAYGWGMLFCLLFFAVLSLTLRRPKPGLIIICVLLEAATGLSHGYALLIAGFASFFWLINCKNALQSLYVILIVHTFAFLLLGFWLMPLIGNLPWTLANDHPFRIYNIDLVFPPHLYPWLVCFFAAAVALFCRKKYRNSITLHATFLVLLPLTGFVLGHHIGLADIRFYPFALVFVLFLASYMLSTILQHRQIPGTWLAVICLFSFSWYSFQQTDLAESVLWNNEGMQAKPAAKALEVAAKTWPYNPDNPTRIVFDHHPNNTDLGSTRALEALPLLGSKAVLEGLYMESSLLAPFIYQVQAEISRYPSSPAASYPVLQINSATRTERLHEFGVEHLLIRSEEFADQLIRDSQWVLIKRSGPLYLFNSKEKPDLVQVLNTPFDTVVERAIFRQQGFKNFRTAFPYIKRMVYDPEGKFSTPTTLNQSYSNKPLLTNWQDESISFTTDYPGAPHIIRASWHPNWKSTSGEEVFMVEPGFMLITPRGKQVTLTYSPGGWSSTGVTFSILGVLLCILLFTYKPFFVALQRIDSPLLDNSFKPGVIYSIILLCSIIIFTVAINDQQRAYYHAHSLMLKQEYVRAALLFTHAFEQRKTPAGKAEALFWSARNYEYAHLKDQATQQYKSLTNNYPESTWYGESSYRLIYLSDSSEEKKQIAEKARALYPAEKWVRRIQL